MKVPSHKESGSRIDMPAVAQAGGGVSLWALGLMRFGHESKSRLPPSEHPNPTTKMGGEFTYPKIGSHWF